MLHTLTAGQNVKNNHIVKNSWAVSNQNIVINKGVSAVSFRKLQIQYCSFSVNTSIKPRAP
jgi:hypothetical protein